MRPQRLRLAGLAGVLAAMWLAGCGTRPVPPAAPAAPPGPLAPARPAPTATAPPAGIPLPGAQAPASPAPGSTAPAGAPVVATPSVAPAALPPAGRVRTWEEYRLQAARRLVAAHPGGTYMGPVPEPLLAIPVLEVELHADGRVREIRVLRQPGQARDTVQLAIAAVHRAAPFGPVEHLPRPWRFTEAFLFDDARRFKPRILD